MIDKLALLTKFDQWCIPLLPLYENRLYASKFVAKYPSTKDIWYLRDKGIGIHKYSDLGSLDEQVLVISGDVDRSTHPLSRGKLCYKDYKNQVMTTHTIGYSPWDFTNYVDYVNRFKSDINIIYSMDRKLYSRFANADWSGEGYEYYKGIQEVMINLEKEGKIHLSDYQPIQYDILKEYQSTSEDTKFSQYSEDNVGIALNWCNVKTARNCRCLLEDIKKLHEISPNLKFIIKNHNNTSSRLRKVVEGYDYIEIHDASKMSKIDFMYMCKYYLVDDTSLGYEISYVRNILDRSNRVNIYFVDSFPELASEYYGIDMMGDIRPKVAVSKVIELGEFVESDYSGKVMAESFPGDYLLYSDDLGRYADKYAEYIIGLSRGGNHGI